MKEFLGEKKKKAEASCINYASVFTGFYLATRCLKAKLCSLLEICYFEMSSEKIIFSWGW